MAGRDDKTRAPAPAAAEPPVTPPFASDVDEWEDELDAWDRALPIGAARGAGAEEGLAEPARDAASEAVPVKSDVGPPSGVVAAPFDGGLTPSSGSYVALDATVPNAAPVEAAGPPASAQMAIPTGTFDDGASAPSGSYVALVAERPAGRAMTIFDAPPPDEGPAAFPADTLPEMGAEAWRDDAAAALTIGPAAAASAPDVETWRELGQLIEDELGKAETPGRRADLALAAARLAELLGDVSGARGYVERALANDRLAGVTPEGWTAAHRARLCLAERAGTSYDDTGAAESLARLALLPHPDQPAYRALQAEWALARSARGASDGSAAALVAGLPAGLPRTLAEAELAWRDPPAAAAILAHAGHARGGTIGAALLALAAARNEVRRDFDAAADQRAAAAVLDPRRLFTRVGLLRDLARRAPGDAWAGLNELLPLFAPSPLKVALAVWAAELAGQAGRPDEAWGLVADAAALGPVTPALARARLSARLSTAEPIALDEARALLGTLLEHHDHAPARVLAALFACAWAADDEAGAEALGRVEALAGAGTELAALAPAVEALAARASAPALRRRALRLWRAIDPARWVPASHALAGASDADGAEAVEAEIAARDPASPVFLGRAARAVRAGRFADAAALLEGGAAAWGHTPLAPPLRELGAERLLRVDVAAACDRLDTLASGDADGAVRVTLGRALRALRDRERWLAFVRAGDSGRRRASLLLEGLFWGSPPDPPDLAATLDEVFELVPLHPIGLGLLLASRPDAGALADVWVAAARASGAPRTALEAALLLSMSGEARQALELLTAHLPADGSALPGELDDAFRAAVRRLSWSEADAAGRAALLQRIGRPDEPIPEAARLLDGEGSAGVPVELAAGGDGAAASPEEAPGTASSPARLAALERAATAGEWAAVVRGLIDAPPNADEADRNTLGLAVEIDAARAAGDPRAAAAVAAIDAPELREGRPPLPEAAPTPELAFRAFARAQPAGAAAVAARLGDGRSSSLLAVEAARGAGADAERLLRFAVERDPASAPAARAWRRFLARAGRTAEAADASGAEAEALVEPALRLAALVRASALARAEAPAPPGQEALPKPARLAAAAAFLRRALELAPDDRDVFGRLRELYDEAGEHLVLAELLARRLSVTSNPFETTALHLARAELYTGPLADPARARAELAAILEREPQHARALMRLADLEEREGNHAATAELLVQRSAYERSPEKLRELFVRLGRIHVQRLPDPKRAIAAYGRVLQLDGKNREALDALSLLYLEVGDTKNAHAMTERLLAIEDSTARRVVYHVRLGQVAEGAGDQLAALEHFRRAVDESPRDVRAISELARLLDKLHDPAARRQVLDTAAAQLRAAVLARPGLASDREALAAVERLRGRPAAADAALELGLFLAAPGAPSPAGEGARARRLTALANPALDDRLFPPSVPPSVRQLFRMLAPIERPSYRPDLGRWGAERAHRVGEGRPPRDVFDRVAAELGAGPYELYVTPDRVPPPLGALPGRPPVLVIGASLLQDEASLRFVAGRALRLTATCLDLALAGSDTDLAAWLAGVIRQFVSTYERADLPPDVAAAATARMARLIPKKARPELLPFALESSGELDVSALAAGIREAADRVGLLASGSLSAALGVIFAVTGGSPSSDSLLEHAEARALIEFALSDEHDDLVHLMTAGP